MPELRRDPVTGQWVCLAPGRASRPEYLPTPSEPADLPGQCPFCEGNEKLTPPEVMALRGDSEPDGPGWLVRAIPNLFPAFSEAEGPADLGDPLHTLGPALGISEVIVHGTDHDRWMPFMSDEQAAAVMQVTQARYQRHSVPGVGSVVALYNHGRPAGASIAHPHGHLYATRMAAPLLEQEVLGADDAYRRTGGCIFCRMVDEEAEGPRAIFDDDDFVALAPWASRGPYETWIIPRRHHADFAEADTDEVANLGSALRRVLWRLHQELGDIPLNWYLHSQPLPAGSAPRSYHWHLEVRPRLADLGGFELATGTFINTVAPETAADGLRGHGDPSPEEQPAGLI